MNQIKSGIGYVQSLLLKINIWLNLFLFIIILFPSIILAEGSKEIFIGSNNTGLVFCNDFANKCNSGTGDRIQFAVYGCDSLDRLYFDITSVTETVYMGFNGNSGASWHTVFQIKDINGNIVKTEETLPSSGVGYIVDIDEARLGPQQIVGSGGYSAIEWTPPLVGTYYIEFNRVLNSNPNVTSTGIFKLEFFDITIEETNSNTIKPGRLYTHAWQFDSFSYPGQNISSGTYYVYSADSIVTSLEINDLHGGFWFLYCNQTGVGTSGNFNEDRKSVAYQQVYLPQYPIFLNEPDASVFPPATITGSIILPVLSQPNCNDGTIDFFVEVDKAGNVEIILNFDPPYVSVSLFAIVQAGVNTIIWDGFDGTLPTPLAVSNNANISFSVSYINGLTNLPLYDVEANTNGFVIEMVSPSWLTDPLVFWDDTNISGGGTMLDPGCLGTSSPWSGCHDWADGDFHTINTWWYAVSVTEYPPDITEYRNPDSLIFDQQSQIHCVGSSNIYFSVNSDPNTEVYNWDYTGTDATIVQNNPSDNFITINFGSNATGGDILVWGSNANCGNGVTSNLTIGIQELPTAYAGLDDTICGDQSITLAGDTTNSNLCLWSTSGDGTFNNPALLNATYTPGTTDLTSGLTVLALTANAISPCTSSAQDDMTLRYYASPVVDAGTDEVICVNQSIALSGMVANSSTSLWTTSGDGVFDDATSPLATYTPGSNDIVAGSVVLTLSADASYPCTGSIQDNMILSFIPLPIAFAGGNQNICLNTTITLVGDTTNCSTCFWTTSGDGTFNNANFINPTYTPGNADKASGSVILTLTANPIFPCTDSHSDDMTLSLDAIPMPQITISPNDTLCVNSMAIFHGTDISGLSIVSWGWDYGDGNTGIGQNTTHTYSTTFLMEDHVMLWAIDQFGCADTNYSDIWVEDPEIGFTINDNPACFEDTMSFTGTGDIVNYTSWNWDFGDGEVGTGRDTVHVYQSSGTFKVTLSVCSKSSNDNAVVLAKAVANAGSDNTICQGVPFDFSTSTIMPDTISCDSVLWIGGSGTFNDAKRLRPIYYNGPGEIGNIPLSLIAYGKQPCSNDTSTMIITIDSVPDGNFNYMPIDTSCVAELVSFNASSPVVINSWEWDFGDGILGNGQNTTHVYNYGDTTYYISLSISNTYGCSSVFTDSIYVDSVFTDFDFQPPNICLKETVVFSGTGDNITYTDWEWNFGDGHYAIGKSTSHLYANPGLYNVTLNVCTDTTVKQVLINALPQSDFTISPNDTSCMGELINLVATDITNDIINWDWEFGDGNIATGQNVTHTYNSPMSNSYNILSIYQNSNGCIDTTVNQRYVQRVTIDFSITNSPTCQNYPVNFQSIIDRVTFTPYNWTFGDGFSGIGIDTHHTYSIPDTLSVVLDVCSEQSIHELIINASCIVDAGGIQHTCQDVYFNYANSATPPTASSYSGVQWYSTGLGTFNNSTLVTPTYFPHPSEGITQNETIIMTMIGFGIPPCANDTSFAQLVVIPGAYAQAGSDENSCYGLPYDFANSTDSAFATHYANLYWTTTGTGNFVDPNLMRPIYIPGPNEMGSITCTMVASNIINCDSIDDMVLTIRPVFEVPVDITVCFYDSIYAQGAWRYTSGIFFDTLLSVYGCDSVIVTNLTVRPKIDKDFTTSTGDSICHGEAVLFSQTGSANLVYWLWDFGDGLYSQDSDPWHTYALPGVYDIVFSYIDENGCSDSTLQQVRVFELPDINLTISMSNACVNTPINFIGSSNSSIVLWEWDFGDGQTATGQTATHSYSIWGNVDVRLTVTDINGCRETAYTTIKVAQPPMADFSHNIIICDSLQFTDLSTSAPGYNLVTWHWNFGDGDTSNLQNPSHQFPSNTTPGGVVFNVSLTVVADSNGFMCSDSIVIPVTVQSLPDIFVTYTPDPSCLGDLTYFFGESGFPIAIWHWDFDDGNFSNNQYASHIYADTGNYLVELTIVDTIGCINSLSNIVRVNPVPNVTFTMSDSVICHGNHIQFTSTASANVALWYWEFGDGSFSNDQHPIHFYQSGGTYTIYLTVTDSLGCSSTATDQVKILPGATADFTYTNLTCGIVLFTDLSTAPTGYNIVEWLWDFDDGFTATVQNPSHNFASGIGIYDVSLIVTADSGGFFCTDTIIQTVLTPGLPSVFFTWNPEPMEPLHVYNLAGNYNVSLTITDTSSATVTVVKQITVNPPPISLFSYNTPTCVDNQVQFNNHSTTLTGFITEWHWDFGDGDTQTVLIPDNPNVTHTYSNTGTYLVTLTVVNSDSCENISQNSITINPSPVAMFDYNSSCANTPMSFTNNSIENGGGIIVTYLWNFDDPTSGSENTSNLQNPLHIFSTAGDYNVSLIVTNINGCIDTTINLVTVSEEPEIDFTYTEACHGNETEFDAVTTSNVLTYAWTFGDGGTSNEQSPTHIYTATGDFLVTLSIITTENCTAIISHTVRVNPLPNPNFDHTAPACLNDLVEFTDLSTSPNGLIETWLWDFGDGNTTTITAPDNPDVSHQYALDGIYAVKLTVTDAGGCENELVVLVEVVSSPIADYNYEETCYNVPVLFTDLSTPAGGYDIYSRDWYFGDPGSGTQDHSTLQNPSHLYTEPGTYTATLIIVSTLGCTDTTEQEIIVDPLPEVEFTILDDSICLGEFAEFEATGTNVSTWYWDFGDGGSSIDQNPTYMYSAPGVYTVTLTVTETGAEGCQNSVSHDIVVNGTPETSFDYENTCIGDSTYFTDLSYSQYGFITGWDWDFGDGATSTLEDPTHLYNNNTDYLVTLIVTDNFGCTDTLTQLIHIFGLPIPDFSYDQVCDPEGQVNFFDESQPGSDGSPVIGWNWNFYGNYYSTEIDPSYIFPQTDTCYTVILEVTDDNGCSASDTNYQVCLHGTLSIDFTSTKECLGQSTFFEVTYEPESDSITTYRWNFNDGSQTQITGVDTISHLFPQPGTYMVGLTAVDTSDCSSTIYREVIIYSLPTPGFTNSLVSCGDPVQFTDISLTGGAELSDWYWDFGDTISTINNTSTLQNPSHIFGLVDSTYHVKLIITNINGCIDSIIQDVFVEPCLIADFELPDSTNYCARNELCFTDNSALYSNNSEIEQWQWNFGDGNIIDYTNYQNKICHTYKQAGNYDVELVVTTTNNQMTYHDTISKTLIVNPTPIAAVDAPNNCYQEITLFNDNTITNGAQITSWYWDFGDLSTTNDNSTSQDTSYLYPGYGNYIAELFTENEYGCIDSITDTITIYKLPISQFSYREQCMSYYTYFMDESTSDSSYISQWYWNFGDLETETDISIEQSPVYIYDAAGIYFPQLMVTDNNQCKDIAEYEIEIWPIPTSAFIIVDTIQQGQIYLQNQSKDATRYYWDLDYDYGQSTTEHSPIHQYDEDGNYNIMLVSFNDFGCPDTSYQIHNVLFTNLFVPNAFVPSNSNPELQIFKPVGVNLKNYKIEVYSAWGNLVFESTKLTDGSPAEGWDGTYKGKELPTGSYIWHISAIFKNGAVWKGTDNGDGNTATSGTVTLIR